MRVGVIGTGAMGQNHVRIYSEMDNVELVGIADVDKERVALLASEYNTQGFTDYRELLRMELDAVSIVVPTKLHKQVALDVIESGANLLVEKPIADSTENADAIIEAAKKNDKVLMIGHIERFNPAVARLKEIIDSGILGKIVSISTRRVGPYNPRIRDVGVILDIGVHDIDIISYLYGAQANEVYAVAGANIHPFEDHATIHMRLNHELSGLVEVNWLTPHKIRKLTVVGLEGVAYLDYMDQTVEIHDKDWIRKAKVEKGEPLRRELEHFIHCIENGEEAQPSGSEGKHALEVSLAAIQSYNDEKLIKIE
ncbi:UDP-N-acetylglucosamine 3-dehydrogenase [Methanohalophilus levihalophilus]|uniref:UDP-N-acetylglucosamine 3-dehydrogenase n=1 Tax=Methanohalophilus levihalophilus TaxID=1431282 RepID=UPI001AE60FFA|nr:UDP-N-acetylglucosamine 3-dehydrogenase [Methanohalophilus levihalophilus]MBP2030123.1 UDP-N-acetylglucosamine 3-dehydrogenase [Methanohalophilus levihalophilus]